MRRAASDVEVDGDIGREGSPCRFGAREGTAAYRTGTHRDDDPRRRHRGVGFPQRGLHVLGYRSGHDDAVGMPRGRHELDPKTSEVEHDVAERDQLRLAAVAAARRNLPELERSAEEPAHARIERARKWELLAFEHQVLATANRKTMIVGETDRSRRTGVLAGAAKEARAEIEPQGTKLDCFGWTSVSARPASLLAEGRDDVGSTTETFGELQSVHGTSRCLVALLEARAKHANHRSCPA